MEFYYYLYGADVDGIYIYSQDGGGTLNVLKLVARYDQGEEWHREEYSYALPGAAYKVYNVAVLFLCELLK